MLKYKNKYRVVCHFDVEDLTPIKEDIFIYCSGEGEIWRYSDTVLGYYKNSRTSKVLLEKLDNAGVEYEWLSEGARETVIHFKEADLDKVVDIFHIRTSGTSISPFSTKNLKLFKWYTDNKEHYDELGLPKKREGKELSEEDKAKLVERLKKAREQKEINNMERTGNNE